MNKTQDLLENNLYDNHSLSGALADLSDSPDLLQSLIDSSKGLHYDATTKVLQPDFEHPGELFALNELLQAPWFEIRQLTIDQVREIETGLMNPQSHYHETATPNSLAQRMKQTVRNWFA